MVARERNIIKRKNLKIFGEAKSFRRYEEMRFLVKMKGLALGRRRPLLCRRKTAEFGDEDTGE